ncbi:MAG: hypothetical protein AAGI28_01395 [Pseudomonadota bacterium]
MAVSEPRTIATWQAPLVGDKTSDELLISFDRGRKHRLLILPALFDEANKLRRFTMQTIRALDASGVECFLPDLPGCNDSLQPLEQQTLEGWRSVVIAAAEVFQITHVLGIRGGALLSPKDLPAWYYAPQSGAKLLRGMLRARMIASRELGLEETSEQLLKVGREAGLMLAGWPIGATMLRELEHAKPFKIDQQKTISQKDIGGAGLWLRAEPGEDDAGSESLATIISGGIGDAA